jgi:hypothetical protein
VAGFTKGDRVRHRIFGDTGRVVGYRNPDKVVVRWHGKGWGPGMKECVVLVSLLEWAGGHA